jgi:hypothetical protein
MLLCTMVRVSLVSQVACLAIVWRVEDIQGRRRPDTTRHLARRRRSDNSETDAGPGQAKEPQTESVVEPGHKYRVGNWSVKWDSTYNAWYYWDSNTGVSTWEKPEELAGYTFAQPQHHSRSEGDKKTYAPYDFKSKIVESKKYWGPWNLLYDIWSAVLDRALAADVFQFRWQWT